jgi:hypothetical protein
MARARRRIVGGQAAPLLLWQQKDAARARGV